MASIDLDSYLEKIRAGEIEDPTTLYALLVGDGTVVAGPLVRLACKRHLEMLADKSGEIYFDIALAQRLIDFFPDVLTVEVDGDVVPFELMDWQVFCAGSINGWRTSAGNRLFTEVYIEGGKGPLALDTPVPTPQGWTSMGALRPGDYVFGLDGQPVRIAAVTETFEDLPCVEVVFDDGATIVCDEQHEWLTDYRHRHRVTREKRTASEIRATLRRPNGVYQSANHSVPLAGPVEGREPNDTGIDPYVLGAWLGDGSSDSTCITSGDRDLAEMVEILRSAGAHPVPRRKGAGWAIQIYSGDRGLFDLPVTNKSSPGNLKAVLRRIGLLGNKHIPDPWLRWPPSDRLSLLQGLMDTDGHCCAKSGRAEFVTVAKPLARSVLDLALGLGLKATLIEGRATIAGRDVSAKYRVCFTPSIPVFRLKRKLARQRSHGRRRMNEQRVIVDVRPVPSVPVKCIEVDSPEHVFLAGPNYIPTGNCGKSPFAAGIGLFMLVADGEYRAEVYSVASKREQAMVLFRDAVSIWQTSRYLNRRLVPTGRGEKIWRLSHRSSSSVFEATSSDKKKSGIRVHCALIDELHEHKDRYAVDMMQASRKGRANPLIFIITNSGHDRASVCWEWHKTGQRVLEGQIEARHKFFYIMGLDPADDPLADESCWIKTNPGLGLTPTVEYLRQLVSDARQIPGRENEVRRLNFCQWTDADVGWMTRALWESREEPLIERRRPGPDLTGGGAAIWRPDEGFDGAECYLGLDLAWVSDMAALAFVFPDPEAGVCAWLEFFKPLGHNLADLRKQESTDDAPYIQWIREGFIHGIPGPTIRMEHIGARIAEVRRQYDVRRVAYDRYAHKDLEARMAEDGLEIPWIEHPQGFRRGGVLRDRQGNPITDNDGKEIQNPLWMPSSLAGLERRLLEDDIRIHPCPVTRWQVASVAIRKDPAGTGNRIFDKNRAVARIDGVVALAMGVGAADAIIPEKDISAFLRRPIVAQ